MAVLGFIKQVGKGYGEDKIGLHSAAFAYGAIFSLGSMLLVLLSIVGFVYGEQAASGKLFAQLSSSVGPETAKTIQNVVANMHNSGAGPLAFIIGTIGALLGAAGLTSQLQNAMNSILDVVPDPKGGLKRTVYVKLKNMLLVVLGGLFVLASLIASSVITGVGHRVQEQLGTPPFALELLNNLVSLLILATLLFLVYKVIPDLIIPKKILWVTALSITLLFIVGKIVLAIIIGHNGTASAYGAAAALISLLLWIYYSGQILFLGAEGMKVYAFNHAITYKPKKYSLRRSTVHLDSDTYLSKLAQDWLRDYRRSQRHDK
jgi:membrane protein